MNREQTRREFLHAAGITAVVSATGAGMCLGQENLPIEGKKPNQQEKLPPSKQLKLGMASYSLRKFNLDETIAMTNRLGLKYICLKSVHLPLESSVDEIKKAAAKVKQAGLELYAGGVINMNTEAEVSQAFEYAKAAGMTTIIASPKPELLELLNKKVQEYNIKVAIHNHGPQDKLYPTPADVYEKVKNLDKRIGLCIDAGHTQRAAADPSEAVEKFADRLLDVHIKDVTAATTKGETIEMGRGVIDIPRFIRTLLKINYTAVVSFEFEKDSDNPLPGLAESVGYAKGVLAAI